MRSAQHDAKDFSATAELQRQWDSFDVLNRPTSLWITCGDRSLDRVLERVMECGSELILRWPGADFPTEKVVRTDCVSAIEFAINRLAVSQVVVLGHSQCEHLRPVAPIPAVRSRQDQIEPDHFYDRLVQRVSERLKSLAAAQDNLADQFTQLAKESRIRRALARGRVRLNGLFYLAENNLFLMFDQQSREFIPLHQAMTAEQTSGAATVTDAAATFSQTPVTDKFLCSYQPSL